VHCKREGKDYTMKDYAIKQRTNSSKGYIYIYIYIHTYIYIYIYITDDVLGRRDAAT